MGAVNVSFSQVQDHYNNVNALKVNKLAESTAPNRHRSLSQQKAQPNPKWHENLIRIPDTTHVHFVRYPKIHDYYIQIVDDRTNKVIREVPPKQILDMYASMMERFGLITDKEGKVKKS